MEGEDDTWREQLAALNRNPGADPNPSPNPSPNPNPSPPQEETMEGEDETWRERLAALNAARAHGSAPSESDEGSDTDDEIACEIGQGGHEEGMETPPS